MVPVGQHMANLRRKGGLGKDPEWAAQRAKQLAAIDPDWNCPWPLHWQRHYRVLADLAADEPHGVLPAIELGVLFEGDDLGKWLQRQKNSGTWAQLSSEQQERLSTLGAQPAEAPSPAPAAKGAARARGRRSKHSSAASRPSHSGSSGKARTGRCRAGTANRSPSTARRSR